MDRTCERGRGFGNVQEYNLVPFLQDALHDEVHDSLVSKGRLDPDDYRSLVLPTDTPRQHLDLSITFQAPPSAFSACQVAALHVAETLHFPFLRRWHPLQWETLRLRWPSD